MEHLLSGRSHTRSNTRERAQIDPICVPHTDSAEDVATALIGGDARLTRQRVDHAG